MLDEGPLLQKGCRLAEMAGCLGRQAGEEEAVPQATEEEAEDRQLAATDGVELWDEPEEEVEAAEAGWVEEQVHPEEGEDWQAGEVVPRAGKEVPQTEEEVPWAREAVPWLREEVPWVEEEVPIQAWEGLLI
jgi:hypothetical protein